MHYEETTTKSMTSEGDAMNCSGGYHYYYGFCLLSFSTFFVGVKTGSFPPPLPFLLFQRTTYCSRVSLVMMSRNDDHDHHVK